MNEIYLQTARLLTRVAPLVLVDDTFALKGGTAINLFVRDMPRLSVDLDLVLPDHALPRELALRRITAAIHQSVARLKKQGFQTHVPTSAAAGGTKLLVRQGAIQVKIEVNFVLRGTVHPVRMASLTATARDALQADLKIPVVSVEDVYGGKLVAAMDRQHPRDLFDVMQLFAHGGITASIRRAFVVYLASHNRTGPRGPVSANARHRPGLRAQFRRHDCRVRRARDTPGLRAIEWCELQHGLT
ncbi:protein containing DUF1814, partial [mine drainage metagenome]